MKKAQAAMEYLMTYGWAILIVIIVAAALIALGVFNPATWTGSVATGFTELGAPSQGQWSLETSGDFNIILRNNLATPVTVYSVSATLNDATTASYATSFNLASGQSSTLEPLVNFGTQTSGTAYAVDLIITYTPSGGLNQTETGTVTGTVV
jgi:hypothetical protein